jgi:hypothetical protein
MVVSSSRVTCPINKCCTGEIIFVKFAMNENENGIGYFSNTRMEGYSSLESYSLYSSAVEDETVALPRNVWRQSPTEALLHPRRTKISAALLRQPKNPHN